MFRNLALEIQHKEYNCFTCELNVYKHSHEGFSQVSCMSVRAEHPLSLEHDWLNSTQSYWLHVRHHCLQDLCKLCS